MDVNHVLQRLAEMIRPSRRLPQGFWRWEMRMLVSIPILLLFTAFVTSFLGIELTLWALGPISLSPVQSFALQKVRLGLIGLGSAGALCLGLLMAASVARPLRRMVRRARTRLAASSPDLLGPSQVNELTDLSNVWTYALNAFDKVVADSQILQGIPEGVLLVDSQGRIKRTNAEARRLLQSNEARLEGQELVRLFNPQLGQPLERALTRVRETGGAVQLPAIPASEPAWAGAELGVIVAPFPTGQRGEVLVTIKDLNQILKIRDDNRGGDQPTTVGAAAASLAQKIFAAKGKDPATPAPSGANADGGELAKAFNPREQPAQQKKGDNAQRPPTAHQLAHRFGVQLPKTADPIQGPPMLVDMLLQQALARRASDIHLEPTEEGMRVRFRIDGLLQDVASIPMNDRAAVVSRIKIMANLDIAEHRLPQDGRIKIHRDHRAVDIRVSTVPSLYGEKVVLRLLDLEAVAIPLNRIGLSDVNLEQLRRVIRQPQGVIFVTGPTGSGKTSTIYACLNDIKAETTNIVTIEDPIEYEMTGMTQIAVHDKIGLSFSTCLRSVLRQDPDVILVGEVRDLETARITMQASLTGHLVFATLHTNDALGTITRLLDMAIPPYLIASSLSAVLAQRLVRLLCPACKTPCEPDAATRAALGLGDGPITLYRPGGCEQCYGTGAVGRTGVFELLSITQDLLTFIATRAGEEELRPAARAAGYLSMFGDGLRKVLDGVVAYEELLRVAPLPPGLTPGATSRMANGRRPSSVRPLREPTQEVM